MSHLPKSASGIFTGLAGMAAASAATFVLRDWPEAPHIKTMAVIAVAVTAMLILDARRYLGAGAILTARARRPLDVARIVQKLAGFWLTIGALGVVYWLVPEYHSDFYNPARDALWSILPALAVVSPAYIAFVDIRAEEPDDAYAQLGRLVGGGLPADWAALRMHALGWGVKGFFLPLMFVFLNTDLQAAWSRPAVPTFSSFGDFYEYFYSSVLFWDVLLAAIGYILTLRLFDSHIRSVDGTMLGWVACLMCYPPLWPAISDIYFGYERDGVYWGQVFFGTPLIYVLWGSAIIALHAIYVWTTAAFGLRFSNLTHRGIITSGPYRWMKHPGYTAKCASYWMISVPFIATTSWWEALQSCLLLGGICGIYVVRAITEERHLSRDPIYRAYQAYIAEHGLWARARQAIGSLSHGRPDQRPSSPWPASPAIRKPAAKQPVAPE